MKLSNVLKKIILPSKINKAITPTHQECIIFGSGPSLDLLNGASDFLKNKDLIGCNFMHQHPSLVGKQFKLFSMIDRDYTRQVNTDYFQTLDCEHFLVTKKNFYLFDLWCLIKKAVNVIPAKPFEGETNYQQVVSGKELFTGNSLPFLIQCAAFLAGYKVIYLYGVDHFSLDALEESTDHNFKDYHGRKIKKLVMTRDKLIYINGLYEVVSKACEHASVKVFNVTPNSQLNMFKKVHIDGLVQLPVDG